METRFDDTTSWAHETHRIALPCPCIDFSFLAEQFGWYRVLRSQKIERFVPSMVTWTTTAESKRVWLHDKLSSWDSQSSSLLHQYRLVLPGSTGLLASRLIATKRRHESTCRGNMYVYHQMKTRFHFFYFKGTTTCTTRLNLQYVKDRIKLLKCDLTEEVQRCRGACARWHFFWCFCSQSLKVLNVHDNFEWSEPMPWCYIKKKDQHPNGLSWCLLGSTTNDDGMCLSSRILAHDSMIHWRPWRCLMMTAPWRWVW